MRISHKNGSRMNRVPTREAVADGPMKLRPGEYLGRNGETLTREKVKSSNKYDFPDDVKEPGWSYQWVRASVLGDTSMGELPAMRRNGWREVQPDALKGYYRAMVPDGQNFIELDGLVLVERPEGMTMDAQREALDDANRRMASGTINHIYDEQAASKMPSGVMPWYQQIQHDRGQIERAPQAWAPELKRAARSGGSMDT